jgi:hypothetical protein
MLYLELLCHDCYAMSKIPTHSERSLIDFVDLLAKREISFLAGLLPVVC